VSKIEKQLRVDDLSTALDALPAAFVMYDANDRIIICNQSYRSEYHPCEHAVRPGVSHTDLQWLKVREGLDVKAEGRAEAFVKDEQIRHRDGPEIEEWKNDQGRHIRLLRARLPNGSVVGMRFDITDLRETQEELERQNAALKEARKTLFRLANIDELTGLTNRRAASVRLPQIVEECRQGGFEIATLQIDLDGFKQVNDALGHSAGDAVLAEVSQRLRDNVPERAMVARLGGDEFQIVLGCKSDGSDVFELAQRLVEVLRYPYFYKDRRCLIGASIGIAIGQGNDIGPDLMIKSADMALYKSKRDGRSRVTVFDSALREETALRETIAQGILAEEFSNQLVTYLQPVVSATDHAIVSAEALVRWQHPELGLVDPDRFLPIAEELRMTARVDTIVLEQVLEWRKSRLQQGLEVPQVSINMSSQRLRDPDLLSGLAALNIPAGAISFEILETVFSQREDQSLCHNLEGLRDLGIELQIDDYGTAHSSISGILLIRPQWLKIDRQFVSSVLTDEESQKIVRLTVALAHELNIQVTAEGVETADQARILKDLQCDRLQGFLFARPHPAEDFPDFTKPQLARSA